MYTITKFQKAQTILLTLFVIVFWGCKEDQNRAPVGIVQIAADELKTEFLNTMGQPDLAPTEWKLIDQIELENFSPLGVTAFSNVILISDTLQQLFLKVKRSNPIQIDTLNKNDKILYSRQNVSRMPAPVFDKNKLKIYRGAQSLEPMPVTMPFDKPSSVFAVKMDSLVVVNNGGHNIMTLRKETIQTIGKQGTEKGMFNNPTSVYLNQNYIYVVDSGNKRVQVFSFAGEFLISFGESENLIEPTGITGDEKHIYLSDPESNAIFVYSKTGKFSHKITENINQPQDVYYMDNQLFVSNRMGPTISIFLKVVS